MKTNTIQKKIFFDKQPLPRYFVLDKLKLLFSLTAISFSLIWCIIVITFFAINSKNPNLFQSDFWQITITSIGSLGIGITAYLVVDYLTQKFCINFRTGRYLIFGLPALFVLLSIILKTPFSPAFDAYDMTGFLEQLLSKKGLGEYARAYLAFTVTNHITLLIYYPFVKLFKHIETGVRVLNGLLIFGTWILAAGSCKRMYGDKVAEISLFIFLPLCPALLLTGPYVYMLSVFLSTFILFLYSGNSLVSKAISLIICGILYVLRPISLGFLLVYIMSYKLFFSSEKCILVKSICRALIVLGFCFVIKAGIGFGLYKTGIHPYPKLTTSASLWALELGTRPQGASTGLCTYFGYDNQGFDNISSEFHQLWELHKKSAPADYQQIKILHHKLANEIITRTKNVILADGKSFRQFICTKFTNYFIDLYRPYYCTTNILAKNFGDNLYHNYEYRYFLYENMLLMSFYLVCTGVLIFAIHKFLKDKYKVPIELCKMLALILGTILVCMTTILLTEVGKRLIFDTYIAMFMVVCGGVGLMVTNITNVPSNAKQVIIYSSFLILSVFSTYSSYNKANFEVFKQCRADIRNDMIIIHFSQTISEPGYSILQNNREEIPLYGKKLVKLPNSKKNSDNFINIKLPHGGTYTISKLKIY